MLLQDIMNALSFSNPNIVGVLIPFAIAQAGGFGVYVYAVLIHLREKKSCYPPFMHAFYLAIDAFGAIYWFRLAQTHDYFWFFIFYSVALAVWVGLEVWSLYGAIKHERQDFWGKYYDQPVTAGQATGRVAGMTLFFLGTILLYSAMMGGAADASLIKFYLWTIMMPAFIPGFLWAERKSREGASMGLAIFILISVVAGFAPAGLGMWTALSSYFNTPAFYAAGVVTIGFAIYQIVLLKNMPPKPKMINGKKSIW